MPLLFKLQMPIQRKIILTVMFGSGIFIIMCTVLRMIYSLSDLADMSVAQGWAGREGFVSMMVVAAPGIWPLVRKSRTFGSSYYGHGTGPSDGPTPSNTGNRVTRFWDGSKRRSAFPHPLDTLGTFGTMGTTTGEEDRFEASRQSRRAGATRLSDVDSEEQRIIEEDSKSEHGKGESMPITVTTEYTVEREQPGNGNTR
jgi:hypothetical protein